MIPFEAIPPVFRDQNDKWNRLAQHICEKGCEQVVLTPKPGVDSDNAWRQAVEISQREDLQDFLKWSIMAWVLYSAFNDCKYDYD